MTSIFGDAFERVVVINLDRRPDRMSSVAKQLAMLGIEHQRHSAADGKTPPVAAEWQAYLTSPPMPGDPARRVADWRDFYQGDKPHAARVAFFEATRKERGIATAGAWGLFLSMRAVIRKAVADGVESLLILEDDVLFHRDSIELWPRLKSELPTDWQILQLGAMQTHWDDGWIDWHSQHLYRCNGSSFAAHAVALRRPALKAVLERAGTPDLPFDIGPLQEAKRIFRNRCFTAYPNLVIQDAQDSEIGMSRVFFQESRKAENLYRWSWGDYGPQVLRPFEAPRRPKARTNGATPPPPEKPAYLQPYAAAPGSAERMVFVFGPGDAAEAARFVEMLARLKDDKAIAPIALIDDLDHIPALRSAGIAFDYVPPVETYRRVLRPDRDAEMVIARRLSIIRRKWLPTRIMAVGQGGHARLAAWRASPFEGTAPGSDLFDSSIPGEGSA
ncbi:glycosyltransferase family 25 protein [uncultured Paracoccus sp.]|uniref:glycosyltransferase family 25 protein n=1 Tax=uncultured Paracoccus sp. TaxID=189685 RepID=UPI00260ECDFD|nr:glycosyltransferase family 25 protein [uncultured Paracoccus sp.]